MNKGGSSLELCNAVAWERFNLAAALFMRGHRHDATALGKHAHFLRSRGAHSALLFLLLHYPQHWAHLDRCGDCGKWIALVRHRRCVTRRAAVAILGLRRRRPQLASKDVLRLIAERLVEPACGAREEWSEASSAKPKTKPLSARHWCDAIVARSDDQVRWLAEDGRARAVIDDGFETYNGELGVSTLMTPLTWAVHRRVPVERIALLLDVAGATPSTQALTLAVKQGAWDVADLLHERGAFHDGHLLIDHLMHLLNDDGKQAVLAAMEKYDEDALEKALQFHYALGPLFVLMRNRLAAARRATVALLSLRAKRRGLANHDMWRAIAQHLWAPYNRVHEAWGAPPLSVGDALPGTSILIAFLVGLVLIATGVICIASAVDGASDQPLDCSSVDCGGSAIVGARGPPGRGVQGPPGPMGHPGLCVGCIAIGRRTDPADTDGTVAIAEACMPNPPYFDKLVVTDVQTFNGWSPADVVPVPGHPMSATPLVEAVKDIKRGGSTFMVPRASFRITNTSALVRTRSTSTA